MHSLNLHIIVSFDQHLSHSLYREYDPSYARSGTFLRDKILTQLVQCTPQSHLPSHMEYRHQQHPNQNYSSVRHYHPLAMQNCVFTKASNSARTFPTALERLLFDSECWLDRRCAECPCVL
jgi:hypothetical protein